MYQNKINDLPKLNAENLENIFPVYADQTGRYFYNLLQTVNIPTNLPQGFYDTYTTKYNDTWPLISYRHYQTPNLWWIIVAANNIHNPVKQPEPSTNIKIIKADLVRNMLIEIQNQVM